MLELRLCVSDGGEWQLQQRTREFAVDASGAFCGFGDWSEWTEISRIRHTTEFPTFINTDAK